MATVRNAVSYLAMAALLMTVANAADYTVNWTTGIDYEALAAGIDFKAGDRLFFYYTAYHSVLQVSKEDYDTCTTTSPIASDDSGSTVVTLISGGYYICGTPGHCERGMRVEIKLAGSSNKQPPPAAISPPPPAAISPPPPAATAPPPPGTTALPPPGATAPPPPRATNKYTTIAGSANRISSAISFALALAVITMLAAV